MRTLRIASELESIINAKRASSVGGNERSDWHQQGLGDRRGQARFHGQAYGPSGPHFARYSQAGSQPDGPADDGEALAIQEAIGHDTARVAVPGSRNSAGQPDKNWKRRLAVAVHRACENTLIRWGAVSLAILILLWPAAI